MPHEEPVHYLDVCPNDVRSYYIYGFQSWTDDGDDLVSGWHCYVVSVQHGTEGDSAYSVSLTKHS